MWSSTRSMAKQTPWLSMLRYRDFLYVFRTLHCRWVSDGNWSKWYHLFLRVYCKEIFNMQFERLKKITYANTLPPRLEIYRHCLKLCFVQWKHNSYLYLTLWPAKNTFLTDEDIKERFTGGDATGCLQWMFQRMEIEWPFLTLGAAVLSSFSR